MSKKVNEMNAAEILQQRERAQKNYLLSKENRQRYEYTAINDKINSMKLSPTHKAYMKLGVLMEIEDE